MDDNGLGGSEVLRYIGQSQRDGMSFLNDNLILLFNIVPFVRFLIFILLMLLAIFLILRLFNVKSVLGGRGIKNEISYIEEVKKKDAAILRANKFMSWATNIIEKTPLALDKTSREYWQYNIKRVGIKIPGGSRYMRASEFNAIINMLSLFSVSMALMIMLFLNSILGAVLIIFTVVMAYCCPMMVVRQTVKAKDIEIRDNFTDFYLMIHYVLIARTNTPLSGIMKSYQKTTTSVEMHRFIDTCIHYIDTYGEYEAARYISKDYRELPEIGKLMRLIRQANEGGEVQTELIGFRAELIKAKEYAITKRMEKLVGKARVSFNILMPILIQAVLSAMSIYFSDLGLVRGLIG